MRNVYYGLIALSIIVLSAAVINFIVNFEKIEDTTRNLSMLGMGLALLALALREHMKRK